MWKIGLIIYGLLLQIFTSLSNGQEWTGRIVGGQDAEYGQFPYIASLRNIANFHVCGGSVVSNRWIGKFFNGFNCFLDSFLILNLQLQLHIGCWSLTTINWWNPN